MLTSGRVGLVTGMWMMVLGCLAYSEPLQGPETLSLAALRSTYETPASQYIEVDGIEVHYLDEGSGPPIVLLHASFLNLRAWDPIVADLQSQFRIIRFDSLLSGLTSADPKKQESVERNLEILDGLVQQLDLDSIALVGTSSGGIIAFRYAAQNPDRVSRLVLINSAGMPRTARTNPNRSQASFAAYEEMTVKPREYWEIGLQRNFVAPNVPPDWLLDMVYDMHRRKGLDAASARFMKNFRTGDVQSILGQITAPTLIVWGQENATVMHLEADVFQHWLTGAPSFVKKHQDTGHYPYIEDPEIIAADLSAFLNGRLDQQLQQTVMVPYKAGPAE